MGDGASTSTQGTTESLDRKSLRAEIEGWARRTAEREARLRRVGYVGTFDPYGAEAETHLDVVLVVDETDLPPAERVNAWDLSEITIPTQPLVYTRSEWSDLMDGDSWLAGRLRNETVWVFER